MKEKKLKTVLIMSFMAILLLALPVSAATPRLNKTSTSVYIGKTVQLKVTGKKNSKIKWKSSNSNIAFVSSSGKVTGKKKGTCIISGRTGNRILKCKVTVKRIDVSKYLRPVWSSNKSFNQMRKILGMNKIAENDGNSKIYSYTGSSRSSGINNVSLGKKYENKPGCFGIEIKDTRCTCGGVTIGTPKSNVRKLLTRAGWKYYGYNEYAKGMWSLLISYRNSKVSDMMIQAWD